MAEPRGSSDAARSPAGEAPVVRLSEASWGDIYDDLIISALRQPFSKDRALLVSVEQELRCLLSDPNLTQVPFERFGPLNSFQRSVLTHAKPTPS